MKTLPRIATLKVIAAVLFIISLSCSIAFGVGFAYSVVEGYFEYPREESYLQSGQLGRDMASALEKAALHANPSETHTSDNLVYRLTKDGDVLYSSGESQTFAETHTERRLPDGSVLSVELISPPMNKDTFYYGYHLYDFVYDAKYGFCIVTISCLAGALFLAYFLMCGAGRKRKSNQIYLNMADRLPLDLYGLILAAGIAVSAWSAYKLLLDLALWTLFLIIPCLLAISSFIALLLTTIAKRVKNGTWWNDMLLKKLLFTFWKLIKRTAYDIEKIFFNLNLIWKALVMSFIYIALTLLTMSSKNGILTLLWLIFSVAAIIIICLAAISADRLRQGAEKLAQGDMSYKIDTDGMILDFKSHAENLNSINNVLAKAVDERTKSEKFKAELITNVSHDIKTPITSIINYVDLLDRDNITENERKQYLNVLKRQSARLKKLTVDLVEASKASTGNIAVNTEELDICEMLKQATGEFTERIDAAGLKLELELTKSPLCIMADGRLLWRVFENLLSNICKYSQPGTRVYVTAHEKDGRAVTDFKNISREKLSISGHELTERFVRGDSSRSTEGSGLGLSIAKSFTEIQSGSFEITVDGDLFKAEIVFPLKVAENDEADKPDNT